MHLGGGSPPFPYIQIALHYCKFFPYIQWPVAVHIGIGWGSIYIRRRQCSLANYVILKTALSPIELSVLGHRISATDIGSGDFGYLLQDQDIGAVLNER